MQLFHFSNSKAVEAIQKVLEELAKAWTLILRSLEYDEEKSKIYCTIFFRLSWTSCLLSVS